MVAAAVSSGVRALPRAAVVAAGAPTQRVDLVAGSMHDGAAPSPRGLQPPQGREPPGFNRPSAAPPGGEPPGAGPPAPPQGAARPPPSSPSAVPLSLFLPLQMRSLTVTGEKEKEEIERIALRAPRGATRAAADLFFLVIPLFFTRALLEIESHTTRRPHASTSTSASTSPASSSSSTVRHSDMDGALGDAHLCRPPRRLVRTSIFAGSSLPPPIGTPPPTSPIVVSPHAYSV